MWCVEGQDVDEWLIADDPEFNMNDDETVRSVLHDFNNIPPFEEIEESEKKILLILLIQHYKQV